MEEKNRRRTLRIVIVVSVALAAVIVGAGFVISALNGSSQAVAAASAEGQAAPTNGTIDFQPTHEPDVGRVEGLPASAAQQDANSQLLAVGSMAPDFALTSASGRLIKLSELKGKTVLVEFFATWCPHCQAEAPHLKKLMASLPQERFLMLKVVADSEDAASLLAFDTYYGISTPSLLDPGATPGSFYHEGSTGPVTRKYKIGIFPTFYVIDPKGRIAWRADHEQPDALLLEKLQNAAGL